VRGAAQGATLGFADELAGMAGGVWDDLKQVFTGGGNPVAVKRDEHGRVINADELQGTYEKHRDESRSNYRIAKESNPDAYLGGEIAGGLATSILPVGTAANLTRATLIGGGMGAVAGLGSSEADDFAGLAKDTGVGFALGSGGGVLGYGGGQAVKKGIEKAGPALKKFAEKRAFKALGPVKKATDKAHALGNEEAIGRQLLDDGVVTPLASKETMGNRLTERIADKTDELSGVMDNVSNAEGLNSVQAMLVNQSKFNPAKAAEAIKNKIREQYSQIPEEVLEPRLKLVDQWLSKNVPMDIKDAQAFKTQMQKFINDKSFWQGNPNASQETLTQIRRAIKEGIEHNADTFANVAHEQAGQVKGINQQLGRLLQADDIVQDRLSRDAANRSVSLTDYLMAVGGLAGEPTSLLGLAKGAAMAGANKLGREYGNNMMAVGADKVSQFLLRSPRLQQLANTNPAAFRALANGLSQKVSTKGGIPRVGQNDTDQQKQYDPSQYGMMSEQQARDQFLKGN
jgi:hypothetical protein